jgi:TonB family protein
MSIGTQVYPPGVVPKRKVPRYELTVPLNLTVLRSGLPANVRGRSLQIGEGGMGVVAGSPLLLGESVRVEFLLPHTTSPVRATAVVRYQHNQCFGLQFLRLSLEHQSVIRYWTRCEAEVCLLTQRLPTDHGTPPLEAPAVELAGPASSEDSEGWKLSLPMPYIAALAVPLLLITAMLGWQRWQPQATVLAGQVPAKETVVEKPQLKVPPEAMQQRIAHFVQPEYPEEARQAGLQGTVVLDAVVSREGAVTQVRSVSGPEVLSHAAIDAVQWWRYEPYLVDGHPATVETTVIVNFRLAN